MYRHVHGQVCRYSAVEIFSIAYNRVVYYTGSTTYCLAPCLCVPCLYASLHTTHRCSGRMQAHVYTLVCAHAYARAPLLGTGVCVVGYSCLYTGTAVQPVASASRRRCSAKSAKRQCRAQRRHTFSERARARSRSAPPAACCRTARLARTMRPTLRASGSSMGPPHDRCVLKFVRTWLQTRVGHLSLYRYDSSHSNDDQPCLLPLGHGRRRCRCASLDQLRSNEPAGIAGMAALQQPPYRHRRRHSDMSLLVFNRSQREPSDDCGAMPAGVLSTCPCACLNTGRARGARTGAGAGIRACT